MHSARLSCFSGTNKNLGQQPIKASCDKYCLLLIKIDCLLEYRLLSFSKQQVALLFSRSKEEIWNLGDGLSPGYLRPLICGRLIALSGIGQIQFCCYISMAKKRPALDNSNFNRFGISWHCSVPA
jgi:hypothetical protein